MSSIIGLIIGYMAESLRLISPRTSCPHNIMPTKLISHTGHMCRAKSQEPTKCDFLFAEIVVTGCNPSSRSMCMSLRAISGLQLGSVRVCVHV